MGVATSRSLEERLGLRFPRLLALITRAWWCLPPRSRLRKALVRRTVGLGVAAANRQDYEAAFGTYDSRVELRVPSALVGMGFEPVVHGREERLRFEKRWRTEWGQFSYVTEEIRDLGTGVLVIGRMRGSGPSSGAGFENEWADLFTISGGRVVREQVWLDHAEALEALDLPV